MVTLWDARFVECRCWNDGWIVKTVVTWWSSASMIPAPGSDSRFRRETFSGSNHTSELKKKLAIKWPPYPALGVRWSALGLQLAGPVSVCFDWVRWKLWSENFHLSVVARTIVWADPSLRYTSMLQRHCANNNKQKQPLWYFWFTLLRSVQSKCMLSFLKSKFCLKGIWGKFFSEVLMLGDILVFCFNFMLSCIDVCLAIWESLLRTLYLWIY